MSRTICLHGNANGYTCSNPSCEGFLRAALEKIRDLPHVTSVRHLLVGNDEHEKCGPCVAMRALDATK